MFLSRLSTSVGRMLDGVTAGSTFGKIGVVLGSFLAALYAPITLLLVFIWKKRIKIVQTASLAMCLTAAVMSFMNDEFSILSLARLLEYSVIGAEGVFVLTGGATIILCLTEFWSILENLNTLNPKGPWKALGRFLKKKGEEHIGFELDLEKYGSDSVDNSAS